MLFEQASHSIPLRRKHAVSSPLSSHLQTIPIRNIPAQPLEESVRPCRSEHVLAALRRYAMRHGELEVLGQELLDVRATDILLLVDLNNLEDVDRPEARAVAGGHVLVKRVDGGAAGHLTVLLVHVVGAGARVVADPDSEVLDLHGVLLVDLQVVTEVSALPPTRTSFVAEHLDVMRTRLTLFKLTISPLVFLTFFSLERKYQKRDLATTSLGAKMRMRYSFGVGWLSVGR